MPDPICRADRIVRYLLEGIAAFVVLVVLFFGIPAILLLLTP